MRRSVRPGAASGNGGRSKPLVSVPAVSSSAAGGVRDSQSCAAACKRRQRGAESLLAPLLAESMPKRSKRCGCSESAASDKAKAAPSGLEKKMKSTFSPLDAYKRAYRTDSPTSTAFYSALSAVSQWAVRRKSQFASVLYPGSYIDIVPSLCCPIAVYVDKFTGRNREVHKFFSFEHRAALVDGVLGNRRYKEQPIIRFHEADFTKAGALAMEERGGFDVLVSRSASGDISQTCASFVRSGGLLVADDRFGDASLAFGARSPWTLVAAIEERDGGTGAELELIEEPSELSAFFYSKRFKRRATPEEAAGNAGLAMSKRPCKFVRNASFYVFRKQ